MSLFNQNQFVFKDTHRKKATSNKTAALSKSTNYVRGS